MVSMGHLIGSVQRPVLLAASAITEPLTMTTSALQTSEDLLAQTSDSAGNLPVRGSPIASLVLAMSAGAVHSGTQAIPERRCSLLNCLGD